MVLYEVTIKVDEEISKAFRAWLDGHVKEMLKLNGFVSAQIYNVENVQRNQVELVVTYLLKSREDLQNYFDYHSAEMRKDGFDKFGSRFSANRRILTLAS